MTQLEALKAIYNRDGGQLRPRAVVDEARPEESPLHGAFCWDDTEAAEKYRLLQAQDLIRSFRMTIERDGDEFEVPYFVNVSSERTECKAENPYRMTADLPSYPDLMACVVNDAMNDLEAWQRRFGHLKEFADVNEAIGRHKKRRRTA